MCPYIALYCYSAFDAFEERCGAVKGAPLYFVSEGLGFSCFVFWALGFRVFLCSGAWGPESRLDGLGFLGLAFRI